MEGSDPRNLWRPPKTKPCVLLRLFDASWPAIYGNRGRMGRAMPVRYGRGFGFVVLLGFVTSMPAALKHLHLLGLSHPWLGCAACSRLQCRSHSSSLSKAQSRPCQGHGERCRKRGLAQDRPPSSTTEDIVSGPGKEARRWRTSSRF